MGGVIYYGAFELMRAQGGGYSRPVILIPMPADGYRSY